VTNAFLQRRAVEVQQQAKLAAAQVQIGQHLGLMNCQNSIDGLDFEDQLLLYNEIHPVAAINAKPLVNDRQWNVSGKRDATVREFETQSLLVGRLEQTGTKLPMHLDHEADHPFRQLPSARSAYVFFSLSLCL
jgi:hypothetical protein